MIGIGLGLSLSRRGAGGVTASQVPALKLWFRANEGTGLALADSAGTPIVTDMTITKNAGAENQWAVAGGFTGFAGSSATFTGSNYAYQAAASNAILNMFLGKSFMVEVDFNPAALINPVGYGHGTLFALGRGSGAGADAGVRVGWTGTTGGTPTGIRFQAAGSAGGGGSTGALLSGIVTTATRHHAVFLMDRSVVGDQVDLFFNGALADSRVLASAPGSITHSSATSFWRAALCYNANNDADPISATIFNARAWVFNAAPPANIADIIAALAASPDSLPSLAVGLT